MKDDLWVVETNITRRLLSERAPLFVARCRELLKSWVDGRQNCSLIHQRQRIVIISALSSFEDLASSPGLISLLQVEWITATVILTLPTAFAARFFELRARQEGFHQRVIVTPAVELPTLLNRVDDEDILCFVPSLSILTVKYLTALQDVIAGHNLAVGDASPTNIVRCGSWRKKKAPVDLVPEAQRLSLPLTLILRSKSSEFSEKKFVAQLDRFAKASRKVSLPFDHREAPELRGLLPSINDSILRFEHSESQTCRDVVVRENSKGNERPKIFMMLDLQVLSRESACKIEPPLESVAERPIRAEILLKASTDIFRSPVSLYVPPSKLEPWMVTCYLNRGGGGNPMIRAFAEGIGCSLRYADEETAPRAGVPIVWGVLRGSDHVIEFAKQSGQYFFYVDHAYFDRGHGRNYRITRNAYEAGRVRRCPPDRLQQYRTELKPWKKGGENVLICPPSDYFMTAHKCHDWLNKTLKELGRHTDRPIVVRQKPQSSVKNEPLEEALREAHALVTHSSNVAIEAVIAGTPVFVSPASAATPVGLTDLSRIESPAYPDRDAWLRHLTYSQFSFDEIRSGAAWRMLLEWEQREFV